MPAHSLTSNEIRMMLERVSLAPSCLDVGWGWQVEAVYVKGNPETPDAVMRDGFRLRTTFRRPDRDTGKLEMGYGRWWTIPEDTNITAVTKTAFAAMKLILEHELMEAFRLDGERIFDPHHSVGDLMAAVAHARGDVE